MLICTLLACGISSPTEKTREIEDQLLYLRGVVVDSAHGKIFALDAERRLQSLDLVSGELLWRRETPDPLAPVARLGAYLACLEVVEARHRFRIVLLDPAQGAVLSRSDPVELPGWVSITEQRGHSFGWRPRVEEGIFELEWMARTWYAGGARPTAEMLARARREARGKIVFELRDTAIVVRLQTAEPAAAAGDDRSHPYWDGYGFTEVPMQIKQSTAVLVRSQAAEGERLALRGLDGTLRGKEIALQTGPGIKAQLTADGGYLVVSGRDPEGFESLALFSLSPIKRLLALRAPWPLHAGVAGSRLFLVSQSRNPTRRRLRALRLANAEELWSSDLPLPDLGPIPR